MFWLIKQNFFMVYFLGVPLGGRMVFLRASEWWNLHQKNIVSAPLPAVYKYSMKRRNEV
jgi:hypothetical protein